MANSQLWICKLRVVGRFEILQMMNNAKSSGVSFTPCNTTVSSFSSGRQFRFLNVLNDPL